jgi:hypothetical protein
MAAQTNQTPDSAQADETHLLELAAVVAALGYQTRLITGPGQLPHLHVSNPQASRLAEHIYTQADNYLWPWADPIAPCTQPAQAAAIIARVLRTNDGQ